MQRFSPQERRKNPVSPRQEAMIARGSVVLALCSICALSLTIFGRHFGFHDVGLGLLMVFSFSTLLSLVLGYAVHYTPEGRRALRLCLGGLALLILTIPISLLMKNIVAG